ncbi:DAN domain family member 5 [Dugong dugon]
MLLSWLTTFLSLLSGAWLPTGSGLALEPQGPPPQPWAAAKGTQDLSRVVPGPQVTVSALSSWKAFLGLQKTRWLETMQRGQEVATTTTGFLPLDPQEVARETCKAVPFTQVLSHPGCTAARLRNHLCFGHCSSFYVPSSDASLIVLCSSCAPTRKRWTPVVLWCQAGSPASRRRVKTSTMLVEGCQCSPKLQSGCGGRGHRGAWGLRLDTGGLALGGWNQSPSRWGRLAQTQGHVALSVLPPNAPRSAGRGPGNWAPSVLFLPQEGRPQGPVPNPKQPPSEQLSPGTTVTPLSGGHEVPAPPSAVPTSCQPEEPAGNLGARGPRSPCPLPGSASQPPPPAPQAQ